MNTRRGGTSVAVEDTMFFPRLRRHAKWMFVFLALVFAVGFVGFGVGAGGTGLGDIFRNSGGAGDDTPSVSEALKATEANPKDAQAWRDLATAYQEDGRTQEFVDALNRYLDLKPKDADGLRELGGLYLSQGAEKSRAAQIAQLRAVYTGGSTQFLLFSVKDQPIGKDPIADALEASAGAEVSRLSAEARAALSQAVSAYQRLATTLPKDPNVQFELAGIAQQAGDYPAAIAAYERFLVLAPDDGNAPLVRQQLEQLKQQSGASG